MYIIDHMIRSPMTIRPDLPVPAARELLRLHNFRHLPVTDEQNRLAGMITDRDLRSAYPSSVLIEEERQAMLARLAATPVSTIMSRSFFYLTPLSTLDDALLLFDREKVGALPVLDDQQRVIGIFSIRDLMQAYKKLFGLGEKGSFMVAVETDGTPGHLARIARILEEKAIVFTRLVQTAGKGATGAGVIYLRVHTYNINRVHAVLDAAGFTIYDPAATMT